MLVARPVPAVREDEDGLDLHLAEVPRARVLDLVVRELAKGCGVRVVLDDIPGRHDIFEAVAFGHLPAFLALPTHDEHGLVLLRHFSHRRVPADELAGGDLDVELVAQLDAPLLLGLAAAVGDEDIGSGPSLAVPPNVTGE